MFQYWTFDAEVALYVVVVVAVAGVFTATRYILRGTPNHGRWLIAALAVAFAVPLPEPR